MNTPSDRLRQEQQHPSGNHTPTGIRLKTRRASEEELVEISPAFRILKQEQIEKPSALQWREFSRQLTEKLDQEAEKKSRFRSIQVIRDKFTATDSVVLRATGYALLALVLGAIALGIAVAAAVVFTEPSVPQHARSSSAPASEYAVAMVQAAADFSLSA